MAMTNGGGSQPRLRIDPLGIGPRGELRDAEVAPESARVAQPGQIFGFGVGDVEVTRGAVRGPPHVTGLELLEDGHGAARAGEMPRRGCPHRAGADDGDVEGLVAHARAVASGFAKHRDAGNRTYGAKVSMG